MSATTGNSPDGYPSLKGKRVVLIVTGGIAAYKSCTLVREIRRAGGEVRVVMTPAACQFVTPLTFATLSGNEVGVEMFPSPAPAEPVHLAPASWGDLLVVAPASADFIGRTACGLGDDLAVTVLMAFTGPVLLAPAMNSRMWFNPMVLENLKRLKSIGYHTVGPESGAMAGVSEASGVGRMSEPSEIMDALELLASSCSAEKILAGKKILVTSGPTREAIDPVRFISNRSSGLMGTAIAVRARQLGADVTLIRGAGSAVQPPSDIPVVTVESSADMATAVKERFSACDVLIMSAAVSDWTVDNPADSKMKKRDGAPVLTFRETEDILKWAGSSKQKQFVVGFALETANHQIEALKKLHDKNADMIVLNDPTQSHSVFGGGTTRLTILTADGEVHELDIQSKSSSADVLLRLISKQIQSI